MVRFRVFTSNTFCLSRLSGRMSMRTTRADVTLVASSNNVFESFFQSLGLIAGHSDGA